MKQVDKHFKTHLEHHESNVPEDMWSRIAPALEEKSRRGIPLLWLFSGIGLLLVGSLGYMAFSTDGSTPTSSSTEPSDGTTQEVIASANIESDAAAQYELAEHATISQGAVLETQAKQNQSSNVQAVSTNSTAVTAIPTLANADLTLGNSSATVVSETSAAGSMTNIVEPSSASAFKLKITKSYFDGKEKIVDKRSTMTVDGEARTYADKVSYITLPVSIDEGKTTEIPADVKPRLSLFRASTPQCPSFLDKERVGFFIDTYLSHDVGIKHSTSDDLDYLAQRDQTETAQYSYGAGLRFSYFLGKGFGIRSGLHYSQLNERFAFDDPDGSQITTKEVTVTVTNADGTTSTVTTIEVVEVPGRRSVTHGNKYHFLDIPVLAFYEFGKKNSPFYYSVNAGTHFNLLFRQSGKYLAPDGEVVSLKGDDEYPSPFSSRVGLSLYASFGVHYVLNDYMDISIEPHFSTQLTAATMARADVSQRFSTVGINTGIRYKF